jgi:hypothetical protein
MTILRTMFIIALGTYVAYEFTIRQRKGKKIEPESYRPAPQPISTSADIPVNINVPSDIARS